MDLHAGKNEQACPREQIAVYLDGDLSPSAELALEQHFAGCRSCLAELNTQKAMLSAFDFAFADEREIELPQNFAKVVATTAESSVSGLRSKKERALAVFLCAVMILIVLVVLGTDVKKVFSAFGVFVDQIAAVAGFVFHLIYGIVVGISIVLKAVSQQIVFSSASAFLLVTGLFVISFVALSRLIFRPNR